MRGEDKCKAGLISRLMGSPPHARGRRVEGPARAFRTRITPACAGKTRCPP